MLMGGQKMTILSTANKTWYRVRLTYKNKLYTGYVYASFIVISSSSTTQATTKATTAATTQATTQAQTQKSGYINDNYVYFRKTAGGTPITYGDCGRNSYHIRRIYHHADEESGTHHT